MDDQDRSATPLSRQDVATSFNDFGIALMQQFTANDNCLISPISIATILSALIPGARGETRRELEHSLGLPDSSNDVLNTVEMLLETLSRRSQEDSIWNSETGESQQTERDVFRLLLANALFIQQGYPLLPEYERLIRDHFNASLVSLDFGDADRASEQINSWVSAETGGKIDNLVSSSNIQEHTRLIPVNTVYFLAEWLDQFEKEQTKLQPFFLIQGADQDAVEVQMMHTTRQLLHMSDEAAGLRAVQIPYHGNMSMTVILPDTGRFGDVSSTLTTASLTDLFRKLEIREVALQLPKFEVASTLKLRDALQAGGVNRAFDLTTANFSGISKLDEGLAISDVIHSAFASVDEYGTEASAATAFIMLGLSEPEEVPEPIQFVVDRPFIFLIRDEITDVILFLGRVVNPVE